MHTTLLIAALGPTATWAQEAVDKPAATPYRPSVSTPAALSAPGWLELEAGGLRLRGHGQVQRASLPYSLKLALSEDWGFRFGGEAWVHQRDEAGQSLSGAGDSNIVLKRRFAINDASAWGLEAGATLPTGRSGISAGKSDKFITGIYSTDFAGSYHTDINLVVTRLGTIDTGASRYQSTWAWAVSKSLSDQWGVVAELSGTHQTNATGSTQLLAAASYNVSKSLVLDIGAARSVRSGDALWSVFTGFTLVAAHLF